MNLNIFYRSYIKTIICTILFKQNRFIVDLKLYTIFIWRYKFMQKFRPGDIAPKSSNYKVISKEGYKVNTVYVDAGNKFPPTQQSGYYYEFED